MRNKGQRDIDEVWDVIVKTNIDLTYAIETTISEYNRLNDETVVNYLRMFNK